MTAKTSGKAERYMCNGISNRRDSCEGQPSIYTRILDAAVWDQVRSVLTDPERIARELERMQAHDPTEADLASIDKALARVEQERVNIVRAIAMLSDPDAAAPLAVELKVLADRAKQFAAERADVLTRRSVWSEAQARLGNLTAWCRTVAANIDRLTYEERRDALIALGVAVVVYRKGHEPRYEITMKIPLADTQNETPFVSNTAPHAHQVSARDAPFRSVPFDEHPVAQLDDLWLTGIDSGVEAAHAGVEKLQRLGHGRRRGVVVSEGEAAELDARMGDADSAELDVPAVTAFDRDPAGDIGQRQHA
jgi:site-specific DNA recombinase